MHNQLQLTDLHYDVKHADIDQRKGYACRHSEFYVNESSFYSTIIKEDIMVSKRLNLKSNNITYDSIVTSTLMQNEKRAF